MKRINFAHRIFRGGGFIFFIMFTISLSMSPTPTLMAGDFETEVTINGLVDDDKVILRLQPEVETKDEKAPIFFEQSVQSNEGNGGLKIEIPNDLPDGYYELTLESSPKYFRDPKGYFFHVSQKQIMNPNNRDLTFDLVLSSTQNYPPCTEEQMNQESSVGDTPNLIDLVDDADNIVCMAERVISLSAPSRQPVFETSQEETTGVNILTTGYHYFGPSTTQDNNGVRGRFTVVDPGVCHSGCTGTMFAADHVYAQYPDPSGPYNQRWMEVGWAEVSWQADNRYIFQYDSTDQIWNLYGQLSTGSQLTVRVRQSSGNTWRAERYTGGSWILLREKDIGFSTASNAYNKSEIYTDDWHPHFPSSTTDQSYLFINGVWKIWDTRYPTTIMTTSLYDTHISNSYYKFCSHSHASSACTP